MTFDPRTALLDANRPPWLVDERAARLAREADEPPDEKGPREKRRNSFRLTARFDWSEVWEKVRGWGRW